MLKSNEKTLTIMQGLLDVLVSLFSLYIAYQIRFTLMSGGQEGLESLFMQISIPLALTTVYFFREYKLYTSQRFSSRAKEILAVIKANTLSFLGLILIIYFLAPQRVSRLSLLNYYVISLFFHITARLIVRNFLRYIRSKGHNLRHYLLIGDGKPLEEYIENTKRFKDSGVRIKAWFDSKGIAQKHQIDSVDTDLKTYIETHKPDAIIVSYPANQNQKTEEVLKMGHSLITPIQILPELNYTFIGHRINDFGGLPIISVNQPSFNMLELFFKRMLDIIGAGLGIIFLSPLLIVISLLVKLTSKGPIFYAQERMGLDGEKFKMWKFRSMKIDADKENNAWTVANDPRRTKIGIFLRSTSIDELPQLWNVFIGNMSLVGPRPEQSVFVEKFKDEITAYMLRHKVKAGITGWAQVNGWRGDTSLEKRIECDIYYIKHWSLWLDIKILFMTIWSGFINKNAY